MEKNLYELIGKSVRIELKHKIFGSQRLHIKEFKPVVDESIIGFWAGSRIIYVNANEIVYETDDDGIILRDNDLCIKIFMDNI